MYFFLLGLAALVLVLVVAHAFVNANPTVMARQLRFLGGVFLAGLAIVLFVRGYAGPATGLGLLAWLLLMGRGVLPWPGYGGGAPSQGQGSRVTTAHLEMELDHDSGAIRGRVIKGRFAGRELDTLAPLEIAYLWRDYRFSDVQSAHVLEAYLDRIHPSWREDLGAEANEKSDPFAHGGTRMSPEEAREILGVREGASEDEIRAAHRELMMKVHPDRGGSNYLAAKINEAKSVLIGD